VNSTGGNVSHTNAIKGVGETRGGEDVMVTKNVVATRKAYLVYTGGGPLIILTSYDSIDNPQLIKKLNAKGIEKFVAQELPIESVKQRYGRHFDIVCEDLQQTDDLRVLDYNGQRAFGLFKFKELGPAIFWEGHDL
jgi:hypothetical protein